jgi:hypothetical protein
MQKLLGINPADSSWAIGCKEEAENKRWNDQIQKRKKITNATLNEDASFRDLRRHLEKLTQTSMKAE